MDHLFEQALRELQDGGTPTATIAQLFDVDTPALARAAGLAFPLSIRSEALRLFSHQLLTTVQGERRGGPVSDAITRLREAIAPNAVNRLAQRGR